MSARRAAGLAALVFVAACASVACSAILGLTDPAPIDAGLSEPSTPHDDARVPPASDASCAAGTDLSSDRENCGRCGHDCLAGDCTGGVCQPFVAAEGDEVPQNVMLDAERIVWTAHAKAEAGFVTRIESCPRPKCTAPPALLNQPATSRRVGLNLVVGDGTVTWIDAMDSSSLRQCETKGCGETPATLKELVDNYAHLAQSTTGTIVYSQLPSWPTPSPVEFVRCVDKTCSSTKRLLDAGTKPYNTDRILELTVAADKERLFWGAFDENNAEELWSCRLDDCVPALLARAPADYVAIGDDALYWTEGLTNPGAGIRVQRCTLPNCVQPKQIYKSQVADAYITGIYVDASGVYFTNPSGVSFCPLDGCTADAEVVAKVTGHNTDIAGDRRAIYWVNRTQQRIYGLAR